MKIQLSCFVRAVCAAAFVLGASAPVLAQPSGTDENGWTVLTPGANSRVVYVSSSQGADTNSGLSTAAPVRSLARGFSLLRDGYPDFILLRSGDTWYEAFPSWNKSANSMTSYMVIGSYGAGPRPKLRPTSQSAVSALSSTLRRGLAITDLDLAPAVPGGSQYCGISILDNWSNILIENCLIVGFPGNIVIQNVNAVYLDTIRIRRNVIADSYDTGPGHSQGIYIAHATNWLIEENVWDNNARNKEDQFCHNLYIQESCSEGVFRGNISARACSHGIQQRPGGTMDDNLFMQNPINAFQGRTAGTGTNYLRFNVALDSRNINSTDVRGSGFEVSGDGVNIIEYNVAAHQKSGTANVYAFSLNGIDTATVRGNAVYDWGRPGSPTCSAVAFAWFGTGTGSIMFENNQVYQRNTYGQLIAHGEPFSTGRFTYRNNKYFSSSPLPPLCYYSPFDVAPGSGGDFNFWRSRTGETGAAYVNPGMIDVSIDAYMTWLGLPGGLPQFMMEARQQSKQYWRPQFTSQAVNQWVRARLGVASSCPADLTGDGMINILDYQMFNNLFQIRDPRSDFNRDTFFNVLDYVSFAQAAGAGC